MSGTGQHPSGMPDDGKRLQPHRLVFHPYPSANRQPVAAGAGRATQAGVSRFCGAGEYPDHLHLLRLPSFLRPLPGGSHGQPGFCRGPVRTAVSSTTRKRRFHLPGDRLRRFRAVQHHDHYRPNRNILFLLVLHAAARSLFHSGRPEGDDCEPLFFSA